jgi:phosphoenolpyruvate carboxylase
VAPQNAYAHAQDFLQDLRTIEASLLSHHAQALAAQRLHPLIRAVEVFGFHLATVDLRQSSDKHEQVLAELLSAARLEADYSALDEGAKRALLLRLLADARPLRVREAALSPLAQSELAIFEMAHRIRQRFGDQAVRHYIISHTESVSDLLEVMLLLKECGLMRGVLEAPQAKPQAKPSQATPSQAKPIQANPSHATPMQAKPGLAQPSPAQRGPAQSSPAQLGLAWPSLA